MANRFASGKNSIAECDRCGQRYKLRVLKREVIKTKNYELLVCPTCWDPDQPQLQLGMYPVDDPQGVRNPRPDQSYYASGLSGLQVLDGNGTSIEQGGYPGEGSRVIQWGWNPIGGARANDDGLTPNDLIGQSQLGTITVTITY